VKENKLKFKTKSSKKGGRDRLGVECLPSKHKASSSNPSTAKNKQKKDEKVKRFLLAKEIEMVYISFPGFWVWNLPCVRVDSVSFSFIIPVRQIKLDGTEWWLIPALPQERSKTMTTARLYSCQVALCRDLGMPVPVRAIREVLSKFVDCSYG
jgi:hypothetical protein